MKPIILQPSGNYKSSNLNKVARKIVQLAFNMGGFKTYYFRAVRCNYTFPNGETCWDPVRQTHNIDCPVCAGTGAYYPGPPIEIPAIFIDNRGNIIRDKYGVIYKDTARMVVPPIITPSYLKFGEEAGQKTFVLRDKFVIYNVDNEVDAIFYINSEPKDTWLAGTLYYSFEVVVSRPNESNEDPVKKDITPKLYYPKDTEGLIKQINSDIAGLENQMGENKTESDVVIDGESGEVIPVDEINKLWES